ncbi:hypothetical protein CPB84DRAFT_1794905 [Gymnopilus junonius]|uniref:Uncharacterized protein n=1 Tax=Gymnopilus junonius TaxID=109634 RepID=A0A9P5TH92_GYMJU|nr:hypothetical protein CPB84DRAFT_1794905 [Gymnopilus junonius]
MTTFRRSLGPLYLSRRRNPNSWTRRTSPTRATLARHPPSKDLPPHHHLHQRSSRREASKPGLGDTCPPFLRW